MLEQPWAERGSRLGRCGGCVDDTAGLAFGKLGLDGLEEGRVEGIAFVDVGDVSCEACCGVLVCEESCVDELETKDWEVLVY